MPQKNGKKLIRMILILIQVGMILIIVILLPFIIVSAIDNRATGANIVNTDGSSTLLPIMQMENPVSTLVPK